MYLRVLICLILLFLSACVAQNEAYQSYSGEHLQLVPVTANTYVHVSNLHIEEIGNVSSNGLVFFDEAEAIIIDTPANVQAAEELLYWIKQQGLTIKYVVPTHSHHDSAGTLETFHKSGIRSIVFRRTAELLHKNELNMVSEFFDQAEKVQIGNTEVSLVYYGAGHTVDNIVAYIPSRKVLFGGCLVKSLGSGKGNIREADLHQWPVTISKILGKTPDVEFVIPGHGKTGGRDLLIYTRDMFAN